MTVYPDKALTFEEWRLHVRIELKRLRLRNAENRVMEVKRIESDLLNFYTRMRHRFER